VLRHHDPKVTGVVAQLALAALHHAQHGGVEVIGRVSVRCDDRGGIQVGIGLGVDDRAFDEVA
jgi:hypothetical protein